MPLVGKHVYRCFKSCSFVPYFDSEPLEQLNDHCICEHHLPTHQQPPSSSSSSTSKRRPTSSASTKRPPRGKSGGSKLKGIRLASIASLLDVGFNEWSPQGDHGASKKQSGRTTNRGATRRKSDRNAPNFQGECASESNKQGHKECEPFRFYEDTGRYMAEYRARHVQRLVGFDGSSDPEDLTFGENLPDPYVFKTAPFKRAFEAIQSAIAAERNRGSNGAPKGSRNQACPNLCPTSNERQWRPSDVKHLPGLTTQSIFATNVDAVCAGMRHVGQDVFKPSPLPKKRRSENSTSSSRRSLVSRQKKREENTAAGEKLEMALAQSRLAMRDRLGVNEETSNPSRQSSSSSSRSPDNLSTKTNTLSTSTSSTTKSKADWMTMSVDQGEATRTMLLFLQQARGDVDRSREKRTRRTLPNGKSQGVSDNSAPTTTDKQRFTAMLCRESEKAMRRLKPTEIESEPSLPATGQLKNGRLKVKVFRPSGTGDIKLEEALKAGRLHVAVGQGT